MADLQGIFVPHVVPLNSRGRIDTEELGRYLEWLIEQGVDGLYSNGSTGEFLRFTPEERLLITRIACEVAAGRVPVLAGAAEPTTAETLKYAERCREWGARAVAVTSPYYYHLSQSAVQAYMSEIAVHSSIDITLYNIPAFATPFEIETVQRLAEFDRVIGIKDSSGDVSFMLRLMQAVRSQRPDFALLTGWEPVLVPLLAMGIDGGTHATAGVAPELTRQIYSLARSGNLNQAAELQFPLLRLFDELLDAGDFPAGFRAGVTARGFSIGASRQPGLNVDEKVRQRICIAVEDALGALRQERPSRQITRWSLPFCLPIGG